ncbi:MAG: sensor histidine kinase, partial [Saprospiraceae bacterium]|nr:sensor histidine kinase [Saprospiraceae bacterium]
ILYGKNNNCIQIENYAWKAELEYKFKHYDSALEYAVKAVTMSCKDSFPMGITKSYNIIDRVFVVGKNDKMREKYLVEGYQRLKGKKSYLIFHLYVMIEFYRDRNRSEYNKYLTEFIEFTNDDKSNFKKNKGHIYFLYDNDKKGLIENTKELEKDVKYFEDKNNHGGQMNIGLILYDAYVAQNRIAEAIQVLQKLSKLYSKFNYSMAIMENYKLLYENYSITGNYKEAYNYIFLHQQLKDSLINLENSKIINELNTKYETEKKDQEIKVLNLNQELSNTRLRSEKNKNYGLALIIGILSIATYSIFRLFRKTKEQNIIIEKSLKEKNVLLKEIHHRVKNNLQFISSLLNLQSRHLEDEKALTALKEGQNRVKSMAILHQNLYQEDNLRKIESKKYFKSLIQSLFQSYNVSTDNIEWESKIDSIYIDVDQMISLGLIVNELITNALKYAFPENRKGKISFTFLRQNERMILSVEDNGIGTLDPVRTKNQGFGNKLITSLAKQLDADLDVNTEHGTKVSVYIKLDTNSTIEQN